jgi:hypothetical protein
LVTSLQVLRAVFSVRKMMQTVGPTLAADYFLLVETSGPWPLVLAVMPLLALQVAEYSVA